MFISIKGTGEPEFIQEELYNTVTGFLVLGSTMLVFISSMISFVYIQCYLKLNIFLKKILYQMSILGIIGSGICMIAEVVILVKKEQTYATCSMIYYSGFITANLDVTMTAMISALRYNLSFWVFFQTALKQVRKD